MHIPVLVLVALAAFLLGWLLLPVVLYHRLFRQLLSRRPAMLTLPGDRPGKTVTYAITARGWRRLTPKPPSKRARRKARRRLEKYIRENRATRTPAQNLKAKMEGRES